MIELGVSQPVTVFEHEKNMLRNEIKIRDFRIEALKEENERLKKELDRAKKRKAAGCWAPGRAICDCPACGGFND